MIGQGVIEVGGPDGCAGDAGHATEPARLGAGSPSSFSRPACFWWLFDRVPSGHAAPAPADLRWRYLPLLLLLLLVAT
jgi:hypothetical protein